MNQSPSHDQRFVDMLTDLVSKKDRSVLAALRRGLGRSPGEATEMYPIVIPWLLDTWSPRQDAPYFLVAALFAWHQMNWPHGEGGENHATNLGASLRRLALAAESGSIESRFLALLNAHHDELPEHLRHAVGLLKSHDISVDWVRLLSDLRSWDAPSRWVQRSWAKAYWRQASTGHDVAAATPVAESEEKE